MQKFILPSMDADNPASFSYHFYRRGADIESKVA